MGLNVVNILLFGISFIILAIAAGFATNAAVRLGSGNADPELASAHKYLTIVAVISWISVALIIGGIIVYIIFGFETVEVTGKWIIYLLLFFTLGLVLAVGILSAIAAYKIGASKADNKGAYRQAIIATVLAIIGFVLVAIILGIRLFYKPKKKIGELTNEKEAESLLPPWFGKEIEENAELAAAL